MEPHREEPTAPTPQPQEKPRRFRIVKLEERIAPSQGGNGTNHTCNANCGTVSIRLACFSIE
jgi:hypothetical protein